MTPDVITSLWSFPNPKQYDFVWGGAASNLAGWKEANAAAVVTRYVSFAYDPEVQEDVDPRAVKNLSWWRKHHPTWIVYKCDRKTPVCRHQIAAAVYSNL